MHKSDKIVHLTAAEHDKLDGIEEGAEVNQNSFAQVNDILAADKTDAITIKGGIGITVTTNPSTKEVTVTATGDATPGKHAETHLPGGTDVIPYASSTSGGLMSPQDKVVIGNLQTQQEHTMESISSHIADTTKHTTTAERDAWNAKETPEGAQAKANQAETNAKNASLPRTGGTVSGNLVVGNILTVQGRNVLSEIDQLKTSGNNAK
ncbi:hypothetical protein LQV63_08850 [Paenibacillus profundus]|uniref:Uncharacterized protein n=1 Tax=Paenibacillus profundus TaxID=1173085 RepID=A0ABS8YIP8_9BACL|nr:hypothetical protein [Paenibacillus profundus]MCE5169419.1 hypothetical protein [Paenibacillus profundus]